MQTVRSVVRALGALTAVLLAVSGPLLAGIPGARASAAEIQQRAVGTSSVSTHRLTISITGITPTVPGPNSTVTVRGTLVNHTGSAVGGITVQASTSVELFQFPQQMTDFTNGLSTGSSPLDLQQAAEPEQVTGTVRNGATARWAVSFPASQFYDQFGVYPIQVQAGAAGSAYSAAARTFLPY
jgi:hypothetical protein